jgi:hypothetical protein
LKLYPNPASDDFTLAMQFAGVDELACSISMTNTLGQRIFEKTTTLSGGSLTEKITLPNELPAGLYMVTVRINGAVYNQTVDGSERLIEPELRKGLIEKISPFIFGEISLIRQKPSFHVFLLDNDGAIVFEALH